MPVWVGHSLRLRSGQALSDAFDFSFFLSQLVTLKSNFKSVGQSLP